MEEKRREFDRNLWNHVTDPFQVQFDVCKPLTQAEIDAVSLITAEIARTEDDMALAALLRKLIVEQGSGLTAKLLQLSGLTRNKILTDMRASSPGPQPSSYRQLHTSPSWTTSGPYLAKCLRRVFRHLSLFDAGACEVVNQATYPGFIRQERAKRQGHEAEYRLATLFQALGIPFEPTHKAVNPLSGDVTINSVSFDLVIPSVSDPLIVIMSTAHTANIGQYGESKTSGDVREASLMLKEKYSAKTRPLLLTLADGVGFHSNSAGLNGILRDADEFCQFKTLWKAAVVAASSLGWTTLLIGREEYFKPFATFLDRYPLHKLSPDATNEGVEAGEAYVQVIKP